MKLHARNQRDADYEVLLAVPAAGANADSEALDLEQTDGGLIEQIEFEAEIPALPNLADDKTVTLSVKDSADNVTFAAIDPAITSSVVGAGGAGCAAKTVRFRLPSTARRYIAINLATQAAGGDNTAKEVAFRALF